MKAKGIVYKEIMDKLKEWENDKDCTFVNTRLLSILWQEHIKLIEDHHKLVLDVERNDERISNLLDLVALKL
jgi:hypothetical protein